MKYFFLFERYGGQFVNDTDGTLEYVDSERIKSHDIQNNGISNIESDYSLPWLVQARKWFVIVDNWIQKYSTSSNEVKIDGQKFIEYFHMLENKENIDVGISVAAKIVAEEFEMRIKNG